MYFITNVTLGYGNQNYISLAKLLLEKNIDVVNFIEPIDYERPYYDLGIKGFKRNEKFLCLGNFIRTNVKNRIFKKLLIKFLNVFVFNVYVILSLIKTKNNLITSRYLPSIAIFSNKNKVIYYCTELFEIEGKDSFLFNLFKRNIDVIISAQEDRLKYLSDIFVNSRFYLVENCPFLVKQEKINKSKDKSILYQGRVGLDSNAHLIMELIDKIDNKFVFHIAGPIDAEFEGEFKKRVDGKNVIYHGYLKSDELKKLRESICFGLITWKDTSLNTKYCAPNKLYEYIQSGMVVVGYKNHSMNNLNNKYNFGFVSITDFDNDNIINYINTLSIDDYNKQVESNLDLYSSTLNYNAQISDFISKEIT